MADTTNTETGPVTLADLLSSSGSLPSSTSSEAYLNDLTSLTLPALRSEPTTLSSTSAQLTNALTTLCTASYPTFLSLHSSSSSLSTTLTSLSSSLSSLLTTLPALQTSATSFTSTAAPLLAERRHALLVRDKSGPLSDVLELPRLIDASIRHGAFGDALDLAQHAQSLAASFPEIPLVQDVAAEAAAAQRALLAQLLGALSERGRARLPALFRACGFLRRMRLLTEPELALAFLSGRLSALSATLDALEVDLRASDTTVSDTVSRFLRKFVDAWREGVHDGVSHFGTIFLERSPALSGPLPSTPSTNSAPGPSKEDITTLRALLAHWTSLLLSRLLSTLSTHLLAARTSDPSSTPALLTQLTYCGAACARIGLDFRPLLAKPFTTAVDAGVRAELEAAASAFAARIEAAQKRKLAPSKWLVVSSAVADPPEPESDDEEGEGQGKKKPPHVVPQVLAAYPPLAEFTNALLTTLNGLRLLAPRALLPSLLGAMDTCLSDASGAFLAYVQSQTSPSEDDTRVLHAAGTVFSHALVPFARRALVEGVYGVVVNKETGGKLTRASGESAKRLREGMGKWEEWLDEGEESEEGEDGEKDEDDEKKEA
jgi:conserved oligomeric Golgi complex subunit 8